MLKKTITYVDYDGNERTEDFYFHLSESEMVEMEVGVTGGMENMINQIINDNDGKRIMEVFKSIIAKSYGKKSDDGKRFVKSEELTTEFMQTEAYNKLFMELVTDADASSKFISGIIPKSISSKINQKELQASVEERMRD